MPTSWQADTDGGYKIVQQDETDTLYLIEVEYVGPNARDKGRHAHKCRVLPVPGRKNMSGEPCTDGYLGTTDDWYKAAWGEFDSLADVAAKITELWGVVPVDLAVGDEVYL